MPMFVRIAAAIILTAVAAEPASAYVGPGAGLSLLTAFWTLLMAVVAAVGYLLLWPIRRGLRQIKSRGATMRSADSGDRHQPETTWRELDRRTP